MKLQRWRDGNGTQGSAEEMLTILPERQLSIRVLKIFSKGLWIIFFSAQPPSRLFCWLLVLKDRICFVCLLEGIGVFFFFVPTF